MSITITVDEAKDLFINLGPNKYFTEALHEMEEVCPNFYDSYPDLSALPDASEEPGDCHKEWLRDAQTQAQAFLTKYSHRLSAHTKWLLGQLLEGGK